VDETTVTGIHVCGTTLRLAEIRCAGRRIEALHLEETPHDAYSRTAPPTAPAGASSSTEPTVRIASMPPADVMTRYWTLPKSDDAQLEQIVLHRLEADLPLPIDQLIWSYRRQGQSSSGKVTRVLAQAARADRVAQHLAWLSERGAKADVITTEAQAIDALYRHGLKHGDDTGCELMVLATPGHWLAAMICQGMTRSVRHIRVDPDRIELAARDCQQFAAAHVPLDELRHVLWSGASEQADPHRGITTVLAVPVIPVEPAEHLALTTGRPINTDQLAAFGPAIGLALAGSLERNEIIQFTGRKEPAETPQQAIIRRMLGYPLRWTVSAAGIAIVLAAAIYIGAMQAEARTMRSLLRESNQAKSAIAALAPKVTALDRLKTYRIDVEAIMADLSRVIPDKIVISSIQLVRGRRLVVKGTTKDTKAVFSLVDALRKGERFNTINPEQTEPGRGGGFTISMELARVKELPSTGQRGGLWR